jgi:hypothetical protein
MYLMKVNTKRFIINLLPKLITGKIRVPLESEE